MLRLGLSQHLARISGATGRAGYDDAMDKAGPIEIHPRFVVDAEGRRQSVLLSIEEFEALMQELEDYADAARVYQLSLTAKPEDFVDWEDVKTRWDAEVRD